MVSSESEGTYPLTKKKYKKSLKSNKKKAKRAFKKAWETRNFEIEMYWKRATYFWAFIASTFVGYFAAINSDKPKPEVIFVLVCIGFILSVAWSLTNKGSKTWQRHWEVHVDLLENQFTGPLYKTVYKTKTFSVSKINEIISLSFCAIWPILGLKVLINSEIKKIDWLVIASGLTVVVITVSHMFFGHGRGRFSERVIQMHRRKVRYVEDSEIKNSHLKSAKILTADYLLNWLYTNKMAVGLAAVLLSIFTWTLDLTELVNECPLCRAQRTVIGLLGILYLMPNPAHWFSKYIATVFAAFGLVVGSTQHFRGWASIMSGAFKSDEQGYVHSWPLSGAALFIIIGLLLLIWSWHKVASLDEKT